MTENKLVFHALSNTGRVRNHNEDAFYIGTTVGAVADGMGGHAAGEIASHLALTALHELDGVQFESAQDATDALANAVHHANTIVIKSAYENPGRAGMGTTLTAILLQGNDLHIAHVGDSRAYLFRDGILTQLTSDHSLVNQLLMEGKISVEEARTHKQRSVITRAVGTDTSIEVDTFTVPLVLKTNDRVVLCTDGLSGPVVHENMEAILASEPNSVRVCVRLIDAANNHGGPDNITVVVLDVLGSDRDDDKIVTHDNDVTVDLIDPHLVRASSKRPKEAALSKAFEDYDVDDIEDTDPSSGPEIAESLRELERNAAGYNDSQGFNDDTDNAGWDAWAQDDADPHDGDDSNPTAEGTANQLTPEDQADTRGDDDTDAPAEGSDVDKADTTDQANNTITPDESADQNLIDNPEDAHPQPQGEGDGNVVNKDGKDRVTSATDSTDATGGHSGHSDSADTDSPGDAGESDDTDDTHDEDDAAKATDSKPKLNRKRNRPTRKRNKNQGKTQGSDTSDAPDGDTQAASTVPSTPWTGEERRRQTIPPVATSSEADANACSTPSVDSPDGDTYDYQDEHAASNQEEPGQFIRSEKWQKRLVLWGGICLGTIVALVALFGFLLSTQYFVSTTSTKAIAIYQGMHSELFGIPLYKQVSTSDLTLEELPEQLHKPIVEGVTLGSFKEAEDYVQDTLEREAGKHTKIGD